MSDQRAERVKALLIDRDVLRDRKAENDYKLKEILGDRIPVSWTENGTTTKVSWNAALGHIHVDIQGCLV